MRGGEPVRVVRALRTEGQVRRLIRSRVSAAGSFSAFARAVGLPIWRVKWALRPGKGLTAGMGKVVGYEPVVMWRPVLGNTRSVGLGTALKLQEAWEREAGAAFRRAFEGGEG